MGNRVPLSGCHMTLQCSHKLRLGPAASALILVPGLEPWNAMRRRLLPPQADLGGRSLRGSVFQGRSLGTRTSIHSVCSITKSLAAILTIILVLSQNVIAHDGPEEVLTTLNTAILRNGPTADLLFRRATEFRAMRDYKHAAADLGYAVRLDCSMEIARLELARLQLLLLKSASAFDEEVSHYKQPLETIEPLLHSKDTAMRIASLALRGEIHLAAENWMSAIEDLSEALETKPEVQWYLWRAEAQERSKQYVASIEGLRIADTRTQSPVIKAALCDALIGAIRHPGDSEARSVSMIREAKTMIDLELSTSRLKSAWLIRHAELLLLSDDRHLAESELHAAIEELDARLQTQHPDPALVRDRNRAVELLNL